MPEEIPQILNHLTYFRFTEAYYPLPTSTKTELQHSWLENLKPLAEQVYLYQIYPTSSQADLFAWSTLPVNSPGQFKTFFTAFARATNPFRQFLQPVQVLWGVTRPSAYTRTRSTQEIDPLNPERKPYLVMYPFVKTPEWYLLGRETRQGMMNEHIRIGKQYPQITQLLLYSFGLQDQEFIVVYEMEDLPLFSKLVTELRDTEARRYTQRDTPLTAAVYHPAEETLSLWA